MRCEPELRRELEKEQVSLARAEQDIAAGEKRVGKQIMLLDELRARGRDTAKAEVLLAALQQTLAEWSAHRIEILRRIAHLGAC